MTPYEERLCRTCQYGNKPEYQKPCVTYWDGCQLYRPIEEMTPENFIQNTVVELQIKMRETEEEFLYELIRPFSEEVVKRSLSKEELKRILLLGLNSDAQIKSWLSSFNTESATCCFTAVQQLKEKIENDR